MKLTYEEQDVCDSLIVSGRQTVESLDDLFQSPETLKGLVDKGLIRRYRDYFQRHDEDVWYEWCGGNVVEFFKYQQTEGVHDGRAL